MLAPRHLPLAALAGCALVLTGCTSEPGGDVPRVAAAFYPLAWVSEQVAGDHADVVNLTTPGREPHDLSLGIKETADLDRADLVVFEHEFQPAVDKAVAALSSGSAALDVAEVIDLTPLSEHDHGDTEVGHDHGDLDPHFWQDPLLMAELAGHVAERLSTLDPDHTEDYTRNAAMLAAQLKALDREYAEGLASCERDTVIVTHDAFGYLERYGLHFESIVGLSPDAEATPAAVGRLQQLINSEGLTTVFSERLASTAMAESLARDTGVTTAVLDPIEGPGEGADSGEYLRLMRDNLAALKQANGC